MAVLSPRLSDLAPKFSVVGAPLKSCGVFSFAPLHRAVQQLLVLLEQFLMTDLVPVVGFRGVGILGPGQVPAANGTSGITPFTFLVPNWWR